MSDIKRYSVTILGHEYQLMSDESEEHIVSSAHLVDAAMKEIAKHSQTLEPQKIAVLAALQYASQVLTVQSELEELEETAQRVIADIDQELSQIS